MFHKILHSLWGSDLQHEDVHVMKVMEMKVMKVMEMKVMKVLNVMKVMVMKVFSMPCCIC